MFAYAQSNVLRVASVSYPAGKTLALPVELDNSSDITGVQFDISVPYALATDTAGNLAVTLSKTRAPYHKVTVKDRGTQWREPNKHGGVSTYHVYRIMVFSDRNELLLDNSGTLLTLDIPLSGDAANGATFPVYLLENSVTLSNRQKENVLTKQEDGVITIEVIPRPDLQPVDVTFTPSAIDPEGELTVKWNVNNIGQVATEDGWSEQISLVTVSGNLSKLLTTTYYDKTLAAGASVSREAKVTLPALLGLDGVAKVQVTIVPNEKTGEHPSLRDNNTAQSSQNVTVGKRLTLELSRIRINEGNQQISAKLSRSGRWANIRVFDVTATNDSRVKVPAKVTVPANQSGTVFYIDITNNDVLDADSVVNITVSGDGYEPVSARLVIIDDELPGLTVKASKTDVTEGDTFQLTITAARPSSLPIVVTLANEDAKRFSCPQTVTIPAGETTATVDVAVIDNELPNLEQAYKFTASAQNYEKGEVLVVLHDNDMPVLTLTLTPNVVSESAGVTAVSAVLTRTGKTNSKITVRISDDSEGGIYYGNKTIEMAKGVETVYFNLGPVDNTVKEGDRTYTITAGVWVSSCSCAASGEQAGSVTAKLTVLDNDGASLAVNSQTTTVAEGGEAKLVIERNTLDDVSKPLTVTLSSNYDADLEYEKTVTIPAGEASVEVTVKSKKNTTSGDSHTVIFTVSADGFGSGTCYLLITDQTLPDARVSSLTASVQKAVVGSPFTLTAVISNDGAYVLQKGTAVTFYMKDGAKIIGTMQTTQDIPVGGSETLTRSITLPDKVSDCVYYVVVNENRSVNELVYTNNTSAEVTVSAVSPFTATVTTDKTIYKQGDKVIISGQISGERTINAEIDVYMVNAGVREVKPVTTDAEGRFSMEWQLYSLQSGHFSVGACFKDDPTTEELAGFDVYGLKRADNDYVTCDVTIGEGKNGVVRLVNSGSLPLSGVSAVAVDAPEGCTVKFDIPTTISGGATVNLGYQVDGTVPSPGNDWQKFTVRITSAEGAFLEVPFHYYARLATGNLVVESQNLVTTMNKDNGRDYSFIVTNNGKGNTGTVTLSLPDWMKPLTGASMPGLAQNDTATIVLRMMPTSDMQLNVPVTGRFGINCENGNGTYINYSITPVSDKTGKLVVDVTDEYTYYTEEKPHVGDAEIVLRNPVTGAMVAQGKSGADGLYTIELPEGYYQLNVTADKHDSYRNNVLIDPGSTTTKVVTLSYQAISVSWDVVETEVEDEYSIVTTAKYEANVPAPVIEVIEPDALEVEQLGAGESIVYQAVLTNKGLIIAKNTNYTVPDFTSGYKWEPLVECKNLTLSPQQSYVIPVKVTRLGHGKYTHDINDTHSDTEWDYNPDGDAPVITVTEPDNIGTGGLGVGVPYTVTITNTGNTPAYNVSYSVPIVTGNHKWEPQGTYYDFTLAPGESATFSVMVTMIDDDEANDLHGVGQGSGKSRCVFPTVTDWEWECGPDNKWGWYPHPIKIRDCDLRSSGRGWFTVYGNGLGSPNGGGSDSYQKTEQFNNVNFSAECNKCLLQYVRAAAECLLGYTEWGCFVALASQSYNTYTSIQEPTWKDWVTTAFTIGACYIESKTVGFITNTLGCVWSFYTLDCDGNKKEPTPEILSYRAPGRPSLRAPEASADGMPAWVNEYRERIAPMIDYTDCFTGFYREFFGADIWLGKSSPEELNKLLEAVVSQSQKGQLTADALLAYKPQDISIEQLNTFVERINNTTIFETTGKESENMIHSAVLAKIAVTMHDLDRAVSTDSNGKYINVADMYVKETDLFVERLQEESKSTCATISLQIEQTMTMTRQAFRGTLTVSNGSKTQAMENVKLSLNVTNLKTHEVATAKEFEMHTESLQQFQGSLDMESGWHLGADSTGTATILFIPSKYAAPEEPVEYSFGGTLSYVDPYSGLQVTRDLYPVTLTVKPSPELDLTYFMQRDIFGDDALTEEVEPMVPSEFAVLINNKGNGDATNVRMVTQQPKIIENEKGLYIDFEFLSSQLNGQDKVMAMGEAIPTEFGTIPAHSQAYAQWWLQSTLLGHFVEYDIKATHVTSYGNENLSLLDQVTIHELIRGFSPSAPGSPQRAFLVNDVSDINDTPDHIYFTDATTDVVNELASVTIDKKSDTEYHLTLLPTAAGWSYGNLMDPTVGRQKLMKIVRQSDGMELNIDNFWQTDRTLRDSRDPIKENRLHFVANMPLAGETYVLTFAAKPDVELAVTGFTGVPAEGTVAKEVVSTVNVQFSKAIQEATFTTDDITLACQGIQQDASKIIITKVSDTEYQLGLQAVTSGDGYYVLTVQTAGITDSEGFQGAAGRQATWVQYAGGKLTLTINASPVLGGTVTPASGQFDYGQNVTLTAIPAQGYAFTKWLENDNLLCEDSIFTYTPQGAATLTAVFSPKYYDVTVTYDAQAGTVEGGTGRYAYGTEIMLVAIPADGWTFDRWQIDDKKVGSKDTLTWTVSSSAAIQAIFKEVPGALLSGKVTRDADGAPVAGARVTLRSGDVSYVGITDNYGAYQIRVEDKSLTYDMVCQADGYIWSANEQMWFDGSQQSKNFSLLRGATVVLPTEGACTFSSPVAVTFNDKAVKAWYLSKYDDKSFVVNELTVTSIAAGEGIILSGTAGQRIDMTEAGSSAAPGFIGEAPAIAPIMGNMLKGTATAPYVVDDDNVYQMKENAGVASKFTLTPKGEVVPKGKAYCQYTLSGQPSDVAIVWSEASLIKAVLYDANDPNTPHYDLQGRRIYQTDADMKGKKIHIIRGKKIVIK